MRHGAAAAAAGGILSVLAFGAPAAAEPTVEVLQGKYVRLVSVADWDQAIGMVPGEPVRWDIEISADAPEPGTLTIAMSATGETPLVVDAASCGVPWQGGDCPSGAVHLRTGWELPREDESAVLDEVDSAEVTHLRLLVAVASGADADATRLRVQVVGAGEEIDAWSGDPLPPTGPPAVVPWILAGGSLLLAGGAALLIARARRRDDGAGT
ncbi:hypothetical protein [Microbacterium halotolerans]|uniref:hypothetical protein n=1 Tax=Microbacterium halotolerans TaxID=246613 RepID=UPI000E6A9BFB|nr:hypothetical protein [Microbacterium halotolerans]